MYNILQYIIQLFSNKQIVEDDIFTSMQKETVMEGQNMMSLLRLIRYNHHSSATVGDLIFPCGTVLKSLELPWLDNQNYVSCIPIGIYQVKKRMSPVVKRTSKGKYEEGFEICNVPNRTFVMFHIGNFPRNSDGCVLTGETEGFHDGAPAVWNSGVAFDRFMELMEKHKITHISIENETK